MHLDCVFSILGDDVCLMMEEMMGADSPTKRLVDEWSRDEATGGYNLTRQNVEFSEFMEGEGYKIVPIKAEHQLVCSAQHIHPSISSDKQPPESCSTLWRKRRVDTHERKLSHERSLQGLRFLNMKHII